MDAFDADVLSVATTEQSFAGNATRNADARCQ